jgi:hypothetical protein
MQFRQSRLSAEAAIGLIAAAILSSCAPATGLEGFGPPPGGQTAREQTASVAAPKSQMAAVTPQAKPSVKPAPAIDAGTTPQSALAGVTGDELKHRWGDPSLIRAEAGASLWQFQRKGCVVLAYLYPNAAGRLETAYAEARPGGDSASAIEACMTGKRAVREAGAEPVASARKPALTIKPN